jgi:hypothetical protein
MKIDATSSQVDSCTPSLHKVHTHSFASTPSSQLLRCCMPTALMTHSPCLPVAPYGCSAAQALYRCCGSQVAPALSLLLRSGPQICSRTSALRVVKTDLGLCHRSSVLPPSELHHSIEITCVWQALSLHVHLSLAKQGPRSTHVPRSCGAATQGCPGGVICMPIWVQMQPQYRCRYRCNNLEVVDGHPA